MLRRGAIMLMNEVNYPWIIRRCCARGCQAVRGASGWCSRTFARVLAYQGQVPVRPALAYSRAEIHPVPTGNVGPKKNPPFGGFVVRVAITTHRLS